MKQSGTPVIIGNWKMNPSTVVEAEKLVQEITNSVRVSKLSTKVMIAAPFPFLGVLGKKAHKAGLELVAQDMFSELLGAYTGRVSARQLKSVGVTAVIVGHSERRYSGMSNTEINKVLLTALKERITPILCIGESERDLRGDFYGVIENQLSTALAGVVKAKVSEVVIAYEPIWAIGTGKTATPEDVLEMKLYIQKVLITMYGRTAAAKVCVIYGGSVSVKNAEGLLTGAEVGGFLVGGASLQAKEFTAIIKVAEIHAKK